MDHVVLLTFLALSQVQGDPPYRFELKDGTWFYGYVNEAEWERESVGVLHIRLDEPWNGNPEETVVRTRIVHRELEIPRLREQRYAREWKAAGGAIRKTAEGDRYVRVAEWELHQRAQDIARTAYGPQEASIDSVEPDADAASAEVNSAPPSWQLWWPHILVSVIVLSAFGGIVWWRVAANA